MSISNIDVFTEFHHLGPLVKSAAYCISMRMKQDLIHDVYHLVRVVKMSLKIAATEENVDLDVLLVAAMLHDLVNHPKTNMAIRKKSSLDSADVAVKMMSEQHPEKDQAFWDKVHHAIVAHSFTANVKPLTIEAKIVQDADRLDAMGLAGVARCIMYSGTLNRTLAHPTDPAGTNRKLDDYEYCLDHFPLKLNNLVGLLNTRKAQEIGNIRHGKMIQFRKDIISELLGNS